VLVVAALLGNTQPASAAPAPLQLGLVVAPAFLTPGGGGEYSMLILRHNAGEPALLTDVTITVDTSRLTGIAVVDFLTPGCTSAGPIITCGMGTFVVDEVGLSFATLRLAPARGADIGKTASYSVRAAASGVTPGTATAQVTIAEGVSLTDITGPQERATAPGGTVRAPISVRNTGPNAVNGVVLVVFGDGPLGAVRRHSNCMYYGPAAVCRFDTTLRPRGAYALAEQFEWTVRPDAFAPSVRAADFSWMTPEDFEKFEIFMRGQNPVPGAGPALELRPLTGTAAARDPQSDPDNTDNGSYIDVNVTGDNKSDLAGVGLLADGDAGATVVIKPGMRNNGPASRYFSRSGDPVAKADITLPPGTTSTKVPRTCVPIVNGQQDFEHIGEPGFTQYRCSVDDILVNETIPFEFTLRIDRVVEDAKGSIRANAPIFEDENPDTNPANDSASIILNPSGGGGGGLPITGANIAAVSGVGTGLLAVGLVAFVAARRRRVRFVTPEDLG
jgi:hypothetical protein